MPSVADTTVDPFAQYELPTPADSSQPVDTLDNNPIGQSLFMRQSEFKMTKGTFVSLSSVNSKVYTTFENSSRFQSSDGGSGAASTSFGAFGLHLRTGTTVSSYAIRDLVPLGISMGVDFTFSTTLYISDVTSGNGKAACGVGDFSLNGAGCTFDSDFVGFLLQKVGTAITIYGVISNSDSGTFIITPAITTAVSGDGFNLMFRFTAGGGVDFYYVKRPTGVYISGDIQGPVHLAGLSPKKSADIFLNFGITNQGGTADFGIYFGSAGFET